MRFAHGAQQEMMARQDGTKGMGQRIREVWRTNLHQEMDLLRSLVDRYPYISMVSVASSYSPEFLFGQAGFNTSAPGSWRHGIFPAQVPHFWVFINLQTFFSMKERWSHLLNNNHRIRSSLA
jgi:hypothetical protein